MCIYVNCSYMRLYIIYSHKYIKCNRFTLLADSTPSIVTAYRILNYFSREISITNLSHLQIFGINVFRSIALLEWASI